MVGVTATGTPVCSISWVREVHQEHADVPWLGDFDDFASAAFGFVEIVVVVDSFVARSAARHFN